jgi:glycosyltransferase involved in cell wall biosynthesis
VRPWLLVSGDFAPGGGMDIANHALARYLAMHAEVHLVAHRTSPDLAAIETVSVHRVWRPCNSHALGAPLLARAGRRWYRRLSPRGAYSVINGGNCCLSGANWVHYVHAAYTPRGSSNIGRRVKGALTRHVDLANERAALRAAPVVICNSRRTQIDVVERVGIDESRVHVVYYGIDAHRFMPAAQSERGGARSACSSHSSTPVVGFVGGLGDSRKGFDTLFAAWVELCRDPHWDADLVVVGSGAELGRWRERTGGANLSDRIRFLGYRPDAPELMSAFDALVHPARYEAYGLGVHEALCRGIPALVSASAGVAERYPAALSELLIRDPDNSHELCERLRLWRERLEWFRNAVAAFSDALRQRTWDDMAREVATLAERAT